MTERLFIQLNRDAQITAWRRCVDGAFTHQGNASNLAEARQYKSAEVIVLIPEQDVVIKTISIAGRQKKQRLKAAPFAIEEQLASDLDELHFACKAAAEGDNIQVLAIERTRLDFYIEQLDMLEINPAVITPLSALLETPENTIAVMAMEEGFIVNDSKSCWSADKDSVALQLQLLKATFEGEDLLYWGVDEPGSWLLALGYRVHFEVVQDPILSMLSRYDSNSLNLLCDDYSRAPSMMQSLTMWHKPIMFAAALVVLQLVLMTVEIFYLKNNIATTKKEVNALYHQVAPGARIQDVRRQMQQLITKSKGAGLSNASFLMMLQSFAEVTQPIKDIETTNLNYNQQKAELRVDLLVSGLPVLDRLRQSLQAAGYQVTLGGASAQGSRYSGRLIMRSR